jgi:hypothetical protein
MEQQKVGRLDVARFGEPEPCPKCGGKLEPAFGQRRDGDLITVFVDTAHAICRDCGNLFQTEDRAHPHQ